jgi:hypothetical protein
VQILVAEIRQIGPAGRGHIPELSRRHRPCGRPVSVYSETSPVT